MRWRDAGRSVKREATRSEAASTSDTPANRMYYYALIINHRDQCCREDQAAIPR